MRHTVFLSYGREDRARAKALAERLEASGIDVWWDWDLIGGQNFRDEIRRKIETADRVLVLWSRNSVVSHFVIDEANLARDTGKLLPVLIDDVDPPLGFGSLHAVQYDESEESFEKICAAVGTVDFAQPVTAPQKVTKPILSRRGLLAGAGLLAMGVASPVVWRSYLRPSPAVATVPRLALVIGNTRYDNVPSLGNPGNDATAISALLRTKGFKVATLLDANEQKMRGAIAEFKTLLSPGGVGLFYYAGHAGHIDGKDYALPIDAESLSSASDFVRVGIDITDVSAPITTFFSSLVDQTKYAGICISDGVTDCAPPPTTSAPLVASPQRAVVTDTTPEPVIDQAELAKIATEQPDLGVSMLYAAAANELALDGVGQNSPFAEALLTEIPVGDGAMTALVKRLRSKVIDLTDGFQNPVGMDQSRVDFAFNRPETDPQAGVLRLVFLDCCRDNPFAVGQSY